MDRETFGLFEKRLVEFDGMRLEATDKAGIDLALLSITTPAADFLARTIQKHPPRSAGFAQ